MTQTLVSTTAERKPGFIYTLSDPETGEVRYVGQTIRPRRREWQHGSLSNNKGGLRLHRWVTRLVKTGKKPTFCLVEECADMDSREVHWVAEYRSRGARLLNMNAGGKDMRQVVVSPRANIKGRGMQPIQRCKIEMARTLSYFKRTCDEHAYESFKAKFDEVDQAVDRAIKREGREPALDRINAELLRRKPFLAQGRTRTKEKKDASPERE